ncbi:MAG: ATP-dependent sacrificial sulfur transferase LarE [Methanothrix sp.]|nr:ATP-dependent sacrificial sulfur transferase LarE [Methanothrix sp.]
MDWSKWDLLKERIFKEGSLLVSFSGGVDSSLLAKTAKDVLGQNALCIILDTETMPRSELKYAQDLAKSLDLNCLVVRYSMAEDEQFQKNDATRCYICKKKSARLLKQIAADRGIGRIADGVNLSDFRDFRPGILACDEEGVWHPFVEAEISKEDIRARARSMGLPFWDKPSSACLSSRIPYGMRITRENLRMVEDAEDFLKDQGFRQLRVRWHGQIARIELSGQDMERASKIRDRIAKKLRELGFNYVTLDLEGFRTGSMNEELWTSKE